jgi:hypothetical protein
VKAIKERAGAHCITFTLQAMQMTVSVCGVKLDTHAVCGKT